MGGDTEPRKPVHRTTTDSRPGESLHYGERSSLVRNRMREICTSGSVRGGDGNIPTYSASGDRGGRCRPCAEPHVGVGTPVLRPHRLNPDGAGLIAFVLSIPATRP